METHDLAKAPTNAVAYDGIACLFRDSESEARRIALRFAAPARLHRETALMLAAPLGGGEEFGALFQAFRTRQRRAFG
ncbi:hypothetical protein M2321_000182 [Rhodoblastus acidophilus]|nr:hypothetical protein [Rhodoblastus acidophilus]